MEINWLADYTSISINIGKESSKEALNYRKVLYVINSKNILEVIQ
jgi:hypothetical protein